MIDIHTHLLPDVDDGIKSRNEAQQWLSAYAAAGFTHVVCTPHLSNPFVKTKIANLRDSYTWITELASSFGIEIILGSELYIGATESKFIPFLDDFILVETAADDAPLFLLDRIFSYQLKGYQVILAHIERYSWFSPKSKLSERMREMGVYFQVNIDTAASGMADHYFALDWVDFLATDNHGESKRTPVDLTQFYDFRDIMAKSMKILGLKGDN